MLKEGILQCYVLCIAAFLLSRCRELILGIGFVVMYLAILGIMRCLMRKE